MKIENVVLIFITDRQRFWSLSSDNTYLRDYCTAGLKFK